MDPQCTGNDGLQTNSTESMRPGICRTPMHPFQSFSITRAQHIRDDNCHAEVFEGTGCEGEKALVGASIETSKRTDCHTPVNDVHDTTHFRSIRPVCSDPNDQQAYSNANPSFPIYDIITATKPPPSIPPPTTTTTTPKPPHTYKPTTSGAPIPTAYPNPDPNAPPLPTPDLTIRFHSYDSCTNIRILSPSLLPPDPSGTIAFHSGACQNAARAFQAFHLNTSMLEGDDCDVVVYPWRDCEGHGKTASLGQGARGEGGECFDVPRKGKWAGRGYWSVRMGCARGGRGEEGEETDLISLA
ncbi:hypothetical protein LTS18_008544 [Coniosporium uncinatum]|uniref:Uncharacterized protein n=1 Tax=Coniosporium uncinatum TaxID=93489 RepID=A0ACC3DMZ0_9PEZI|nr:hypothetical protein LTS18_008544 [Coniosporium uncinatum]